MQGNFSCSQTSQNPSLLRWVNCTQLFPLPAHFQLANSYSALRTQGGLPEHLQVAFPTTCDTPASQKHPLPFSFRSFKLKENKLYPYYAISFFLGLESKTAIKRRLAISAVEQHIGWWDRLLSIKGWQDGDRMTPLLPFSVSKTKCPPSPLLALKPTGNKTFILKMSAFFIVGNWLKGKTVPKFTLKWKWLTGWSFPEADFQRGGVRENSVSWKGWTPGKWVSVTHKRKD